VGNKALLTISFKLHSNSDYTVFDIAAVDARLSLFFLGKRVKNRVCAIVDVYKPLQLQAI
jgi:hypothetical protein